MCPWFVTWRLVSTIALPVVAVMTWHREKRSWRVLSLSTCSKTVYSTLLVQYGTLRGRHNGHDNVSNHQPRECLLNSLIRCRSKKTSKLRVTGLCAGNSPETSEFPAQMTSNAENVSIWWRHHEAEPAYRWCIAWSTCFLLDGAKSLPRPCDVELSPCKPLWIHLSKILIKKTARYFARKCVTVSTKYVGKWGLFC